MIRRLVCPLCLADLSGEQLRGYCIADSAVRVIDVPLEPPHGKALETLECAANCAFDLKNGLHLRHIGCPAINPYWDKESASFRVITPSTRNWETGLLHYLASMEHLSNAVEMWFPFALLLSMAETAESRHSAARVGLIGTRSAGKTVLSTMALSYATFMTESPQGLGYYVYERPNPASGHSERAAAFERWAEVVASIFEAGGMGSQPMPTEPSNDVGNVRAVFFPLSSHEEAPQVPKKPRRNSFWDALVREDTLQQGAGSDRSIFPRHPAVVFYDLAGEHAERGFDPVLSRLQLREALDVLGIVIDGARVSGEGEGQDTVALALRWLGDLSLVPRESRPSVALVLSKIDKLCSADERLALVRPPDDLEDEQDRSYLEGVLRKSGSSAAEPILRYFSAPRGIDRVFLVWTEDIESGRPRARNVDRFVQWCLKAARVG